MPLLLPLSLRLKDTLLALVDSKNLLGFSGGVDSVALFFLLLEYKIPFDIAIVHYHKRQEADKEVAYAQSLAKAYNKRCFLAHAPHFKGNFEAKAREFRFNFFDEIMHSQGYAKLLLAHQLNDRIEWLFMQLARGAGLDNLLGFMDMRHGSVSYPIVRPLESIAKDELYAYCKEHGLEYFEDSSNRDLSLKRNEFRHRFCNDFVREFAPGLSKSLEYLAQDKARLQCPYTSLSLPHLQQKFKEKGIDFQNLGVIFAIKNVYGLDSEKLDTKKLKSQNHKLLQGCDKIAKLCGYVLSNAQREEILKTNFNTKLHHLIIARNNHAVYIALDIFSMYQIVTINPMDKNFKHFCGKAKVPPKLRGMLWSEFCLSLEENKALMCDVKSSQNQVQILKIYDDFWQKVKRIFDL